MSKYGETGVDVDKKGINLFTAVSPELYEHAFCKIYKHPKREDTLIVLHLDGVGSKSVQRWLNYKELQEKSVQRELQYLETGDLEAFEGDADDAGEMNLGDAMCAGLDPIIFGDYMAINPKSVPKSAYIKAVNRGFEKYFSNLREYGISVIFGGGETADLPDQEKTYDVVGAIYAEGTEEDVITGDRIEDGDIIIGVRSGGQAVWEEKRNSGHMSNMSTLARHFLMSPEYEKKYPQIRGEAPYQGRFRLDDYHKDLGMTVGEALISPTRHLSIVIKHVLKNHREDVHGLILNTGGGQTKCLKLGNNIHYAKDFTRTEDHDPLFYLVQEESKESWYEMFRNGNMGFGLDIIAVPEAEKSIVSTINSMKIGAEKTGDIHIQEGKNMLTINSRFGTFNYPK